MPNHSTSTKVVYNFFSQICPTSKKLTDQQVSDMIKKTAVKPNERKQRIMTSAGRQTGNGWTLATLGRIILFWAILFNLNEHTGQDFYSWAIKLSVGLLTKLFFHHSYPSERHSLLTYECFLIGPRTASGTHKQLLCCCSSNPPKA